MFIEQLRCDYNVSKPFQEERIFSPTKPTMDSGLYTETVSTMIGIVMSAYLYLTEQVLWMRATAPFARGDSRVSMRGGFFRNF